NFAAPRPISVRKADGSWQSFKPVTQTNLFQVVVDQQDNKWFIVQGNSGGVMVFNEGDDFNSTTDDKVRFINTGNSVLTSNTINCLTVDLDGAVWIGTDAGPFVFECGSNVFDSSCKGSQRRVVEGGIPALLLDGEDIRTIAVDGGNRKWFGSTTGVYVQSASGEQQIHKFTTDNSPLFDNTIQKIGINNKNGEVFIATDKGMVSYKGEATEGGIFHIDANILVYPNPVKPDYDGPIAIKGLASNSNVKITDITGRLVFETKAVGGQAIWYGSDLSGKRAASGVYLVFSTAELLIDKPDAAIAKILFIN
ncbi:MAG: T9SS type A sorting domain-containing protein, partial [Saprospiraceae bacterium]